MRSDAVLLAMVPAKANATCEACSVDSSQMRRDTSCMRCRQCWLLGDR